MIRSMPFQKSEKAVAADKAMVVTDEKPHWSESARVVMASANSVDILLCTMNGVPYLAEQLESVMRQTHANWKIWASDDGSQDHTLDLLAAYQAKWGRDRLFVRSGPQAGFVANFFSLINCTDLQANYFAFCDQDDIWEADKLTRALAWIETVPSDVPAVYCSRTRLIDDRDHEIGMSPLFLKPPGFANALMQNIGGGNTMVFNRAALNLLRKAGSGGIGVITHDWWVYLVVTACGGRVFYDPIPSLRYRQHDNNVAGASIGWRARLTRIRNMFRGMYIEWNEQNIRTLHKLYGNFSPENQRVFDAYVAARQRWLLPRILGFWRAGIYRQTMLGTLGLMVAILFKKV